MKTFVVVLIILASFQGSRVSAQLVPYNATTMHYEVTPDQAMTIARTWSGNPSLSLSLAGVIAFNDLPGYEQYICRSSDHQSFEVKCHTGWLWSWSNGTEHQNYQASLNQNQQTTLSQSQIEQSALTFAQTHYPNFSILGMQELLYNDGTVVFCSKTASGVWFKGNICSIDMNTFDNQPMGYTAVADPSGVTVPTTASLSVSQAEAIALNWLMTPQASTGDPILSAFTTQPSELWVVKDDLGQQRFVWTVYAAKSTSMANYTYSLWVQNNYDLAYSCEIGIDAHTGERATYLEWLGGKKPLGSKVQTWHSQNNTKPIVKQVRKAKLSYPQLELRLNGDNTDLMFPALQIWGHPYFYVGYLCYGDPKAKLTIRNQTLQFTSPTRRLTSHLKEQTYKLNGQTKRMLSKPMIVNGRCYIPMDVMQTVLGGKWSYDAKAQTVHYDPLQVKQAHR
jgi:hypothetical protein